MPYTPNADWKVNSTLTDSAGNPLGHSGGDPVEVSVQNQQAQATSVGQTFNTERVEDTAPQQFALGPGNEQTRGICDPVGSVFMHPHPPQVWDYSAEHTSQAADSVVHAAPGANYALYITDIFIQVEGEVTVSLEEEDTSDVLKFRFYGKAAGDGVSKSFRCPIKLTANKALSVSTSAAVTCFVNVTGFVSYVGS